MTFERTRREALQTIVLGGVAAATPAIAKPSAGFPKGFLWGTGTSAHQVEGNNVNSDVWLIEGLPESGFAATSGDACDQYHRFEADVRLLARLGLNTYRFSVEWARVEPRPGQFSVAELDHYRAVLAACRSAGLKTVVTLHHFSSPLWLARQGGFTNIDVVPAFARYAAKVVEHCGDLIDWLSTFNEANLSFTEFYPQAQIANMLAAARRASGSERFASFLFDDVNVSKPIVRQAHVAARNAVKRLRPDLPFGITLALNDIQDAPGSRGAGAAMRSKLYDVWLEAARDDDYLGVQNYTRMRYDHRGPIPPPKDALLTQLRQEVYAPSLANAVRHAASVSRVPILVSEHGIGTEDDTLRARFTQEALSGLLRCIGDGVDVRGYIHWSAFDNFEWAFGYGPKFGVIAVDRQTQARTPKPSAHVLGAIAQRNAL